MKVLVELRKYNKNVEKHYKEYKEAEEIWSKIIGILAGSPSHIEVLRKKEDDPRRHRSRCNYYDKGTKCCSTSMSHYYPSFCGDVAHCIAYNTSLLDNNSAK